MSENAFFGRMDPKTGAPLNWKPNLAVRAANMLRGVVNYIGDATSAVYGGMSDATAFGAKHAAKAQTNLRPVLGELQSLVSTIGEAAAIGSALGNKTSDKVLRGTTEAITKGLEYDEKITKGVDAIRAAHRRADELPDSAVAKQVSAMRDSLSDKKGKKKKKKKKKRKPSRRPRNPTNRPGVKLARTRR